MNAFMTDPADKNSWVLGKQLRHHAQQRPDAPFVTFEFGESLTYSQMLQQSESLAAALHDIGVTRGDRIAMLMENSIELLLTWFGANLLGAAEAPINTANKGFSLEHAVNNSGARVAVVDAQYLPRLAESAEFLHNLQTVIVVGETDFQAPWPTIAFETVRTHGGTPPEVDVTYRDLAAIIYTSGTSGPAKGVLSPHGLAYNLGRQVAERLEITPQDTYYVCLPLFHSNAQWAQVYAALIAGAQVALATRFSATRWLDNVRRSGATVSSLLGVMSQFLMAQPELPTDREHPLRRAVAIPMPSNLAIDFERRFGIDAVPSYGMTEISLVLWQQKGNPIKPGSSGKPMGDMFEVALIDPETDERVAPGEVGEIAIRPRDAWTLTTGYNDMPDVTAEAFRNLWFHTGDAARQDENGDFFFVDRIRDRIRRRGENVSSFDIEAALGEVPGVVECAAVGVPASEGEDDIKVSVVTSIHLDPVEMIEHCKKRLPYFAVPRYIEFRDALPKTPNGKILKREIRAQGLLGTEWDREVACVLVGRDS